MFWGLMIQNYVYSTKCCVKQVFMQAFLLFNFSLRLEFQVTCRVLPLEFDTVKYNVRNSFCHYTLSFALLQYYKIPMH